MTDPIKIKVHGVEYNVDLDNLKQLADQVDFSLIDGRRFKLERTNKDGNKHLKDKLKLNEIFEAIITQYPKLESSSIKKSYEHLKEAGYGEKDNALINQIVKAVHKKFKSSDRERIDLMMKAHEAGLAGPATLTYDKIKAFHTQHGKMKGAQPFIKEIIKQAVKEDNLAEEKDPDLNLAIAKCYVEGIGGKDPIGALDICSEFCMRTTEHSRGFLDLAVKIMDENTNLKNLANIEAYRDPNIQIPNKNANYRYMYLAGKHEYNKKPANSIIDYAIDQCYYMKADAGPRSFLDRSPKFTNEELRIIGFLISKKIDINEEIEQHKQTIREKVEKSNASRIEARNKDRIEWREAAEKEGLGDIVDDPTKLTYDKIKKFHDTFKDKKGAQSFINEIVHAAVEKGKGNAKLNYDIAICYAEGIVVKQDLMRALKICSEFCLRSSDMSYPFLRLASTIMDENFYLKVRLTENEQFRDPYLQEQPDQNAIYFYMYRAAKEGCRSISEYASDLDEGKELYKIKTFLESY